MQIDAKPMSTVPAVESGTSLPRTVYTRAELARRIANGEVLVVHRRLIYKLDRWASQHPGGDTAILHFVGRDAKDEIEVYHSDETIARMRKFAVAQLAEEDATDVSKGRVYKPLMPPIQLGYRHGALEHPHAQLAAWNAYVAMHPEAKNKERVLSFPLPVDMLEPPPSSLDSVREARISAAFEQLHMRLKEAALCSCPRCRSRMATSQWACIRHTTAALCPLMRQRDGSSAFSTNCTLSLCPWRDSISMRYRIHSCCYVRAATCGSGSSY
ncbi:lipid metabolic oxidoreductase [Malassezia pachydermatis]